MTERSAMPETNDRDQDGLGKERIGAFSDGVFAIAVTLLVLDLKLPALPPGLSHAQAGALLAHKLRAMWPQVLAYALSFMIVGVYWVAHHLMLASVRRVDRTLLWLNNLFLMCIAFVPFAASLLGAYHDQSPAVAAYGACLVVSSLALQLWWTYATRGGRLLHSDVTPRYVRLGAQRTLIAAGIYLAATMLAFVAPLVSVALYWGGLFYYIFLQSHVDKHLEARRPAAVQATEKT